LGRDFAYHSIVEYLNHLKLIDAVVITNSNYSAQPLWMTDLFRRQFKTHMIWYAQNTKPMVYASDQLRADFPNYRHMRVDEHWVWTDGYAAYLKSLLVPGEIHVVGPILWHLPEPIESKIKSQELVTIVVFDVTPVRDEVAEGIGMIGNYYSAKNMNSFLDGVMNCKEHIERDIGKQVKVILKHKRGYNSGHSLEYIEHIEKLQATECIELVPFNANIFSLISDADIVVVVPYSSPAYVAHMLGVPSIFFDSSCGVFPVYDEEVDIWFASGEKELLHVVNKILGKNKNLIK
jgi:polysaccharide biosynthesis PFTS motif protein